MWYVASAYLTLLLVTAIPAAQFLIQPLVWGGLVMGGALLIARMLFARWPQVSRSALGLAMVGLVLAGLLEESLHGWALARFGVFDPELIGPSIGLFAVIVGSAAAGFAVLVAPRGASLPPLAIAIGGALVSGLVVAMNMSGLGDGIDPRSLAPAILMAAGGGYALIVAFIAVLVAVRRELPDDAMAPE